MGWMPGRSSVAVSEAWRRAAHKSYWATAWLRLSPALALPTPQPTSPQNKVSIHSIQCSDRYISSPSPSSSLVSLRVPFHHGHVAQQSSTAIRAPRQPQLVHPPPAGTRHLSGPGPPSFSGLLSTNTARAELPWRRRAPTWISRLRGAAAVAVAAAARPDTSRRRLVRFARQNLAHLPSFLLQDFLPFPFELEPFMIFRSAGSPLRALAS
jgi:hypothetical protein